MLSRGKRLTRSAFKTVAAGKRAVSPHFSITYSVASEGRAAAVVSKKVARRAVDRHRLKRRMLAVLALHLAPGTALIIYARAGSANLSYKTVTDEITELLRGLHRSK